MTTTVTNKWQARIEQRSEHEVVPYVFQLVQYNHVPIEDVAPFLRADQLQSVQNAIAERARIEAQSRADAEERRLRQEDHSRQVAARIAAFRLANPFPVPPLTLVEAENLGQYDKPDENNERAVFDILRRYYITQLIWTCNARYHYDDFDEFDDCQIVSVTIGDDIEVGNGFGTLSLEELFPDDLEDGVVDTLEEAINNIARARAVR
jgi:hypothetical protein